MFNDILQKGKEIINSIHERILNKPTENKDKKEIVNAEITLSQKQIVILNRGYSKSCV